MIKLYINKYTNELARLAFPEWKLTPHAYLLFLNDLCAPRHCKRCNFCLGSGSTTFIKYDEAFKDGISFYGGEFPRLDIEGAVRTNENIRPFLRMKNDQIIHKKKSK